VLHLFTFVVAAATLSNAAISTIETSVQTGMAERHIPSVVVRVDRDGAPVYSRAFGLRDVANGLPADVQTRYQYGSITKQFTAASILLLAQDGKLGLDDSVGKWLPDFAKFPVTIRQVLVHTSGIPDFTDEADYALKIAPLPFEGYAPVLAWALARPINFPPGTQARYDNAAYTVLARIIEKASGVGYEEFLNQRIFVPLGMTTVHGYRMLAVQSNTARGYLWWNADLQKALPNSVQPIALGTLIDAFPWNLRQVDGAGFLVGEAVDLQIWGNALLAGKLLHGQWRDDFYTPGKLNDGTLTATGGDNKLKNRAYYCYGGLAKISVDGTTVYGANGGTFGFLAFTAIIPSKHLTVTVLTNEGQIDNSKLTTPILDALVK
jgi:D-alanyl-D-alanine carboxypeptidase